MFRAIFGDSKGSHRESLRLQGCPTVPGVDECLCAGVKYLEDLDVGDVIYLEPNKSSNKVSVANSRGGGGDVSGRTPPPPPLETWLYFCSSF